MTWNGYLVTVATKLNYLPHEFRRLEQREQAELIAHYRISRLGAAYEQDQITRSTKKKSASENTPPTSRASNWGAGSL